MPRRRGGQRAGSLLNPDSLGFTTRVSVEENLKAHWQHLYETMAPTKASWYQPTPESSLDFIQATGITPQTPVLEVGGGSSTLVDHLLKAGFADLTVLDVAPAAIAASQTRLGVAASRVQWITTDITTFQPRRQYGLWHDRAVFHFLIDPARRRRYVDVLRAALAPRGHVILATFGPEGPTSCSGLPVQRYSADQLTAFLTPGFRLTRSQLVDHRTPAGQTQQFLYGWWRSEA